MGLPSSNIHLRSKCYGVKVRNHCLCFTPLLIKGRNLYRNGKTKAKDRILLEKHARGGAARLNREARIQQREMRKLQNCVSKPFLVKQIPHQYKCYKLSGCQC